MAPLSMRDFADAAPGSGGTLVLRIYPTPDPVTYPTLMLNLALRSTLGFLAILACMVPLRLLYRNGEFAAIVFVVNNLCLCLLNTLNALIWHDDNMDDWYLGWGFCDLHPYLYVPMLMLFTTSVLAQARSMTEKVSLVRVSPMTKRERRRHNWIQALIMFPIPIMQLAWIYPLTAQRYVVATLVGCDWRVDGSWPWLVFFILPTPILSIMAGIYAFITWRRYRVLRKSTRGVFAPDSAASARSKRTARRLYLLTLTILIPYVPISCAHAALNITQNFPMHPFDFHRIHYNASPFPWNSILTIPSTNMNFMYINLKYIPIFSGLLILFFFGGTQDAINDYRRLMLAIGLGKIFPILHKEYRPDQGTNELRTISVDDDDYEGLKGTATMTSYQLKKLSNSTQDTNKSRPSTSAAPRTGGHPSDDLPDLDIISPVEHLDFVRQPPATTAREPAGDNPSPPHERPTTPLREYLTTSSRDGSSILAPERSGAPFLFRTHINIPHIPFPSLAFLKRKNKSRSPARQQDPPHPGPSRDAPPTAGGGPIERITSATSQASFTMRNARMKFSTRVWSDESAEPGSNLHPLQTHGEFDEDRVTVATEITQHAR